MEKAKRVKNDEFYTRYEDVEKDEAEGVKWYRLSAGCLAMTNWRSSMNG